MAAAIPLDIEPIKPVRRSRGLLLDAVTALTVVDDADDNHVIALDGSASGPVVDRVGAGVQLATYGCGGLARVPNQFCTPDPDDPFTPNDWGSSLIGFGGFALYGDETCSPLSTDYPWLQARLDDRWAVMTSEQVTKELIAGGSTATSPATPNFVSAADVVTTGPIPAELLLPKAEEALALRLHGGQGIIHITPAALALSDVFHRLSFENGLYISPGGHIVVADAGNTGIIPPEGEDDPAAGVEWAYVSSLVGFAASAPRLIGDSDTGLDRARNQWHARKIAEVVVAFEPCSVAAIEYCFPNEGCPS